MLLRYERVLCYCLTYVFVRIEVIVVPDHAFGPLGTTSLYTVELFVDLPVCVISLYCIIFLHYGLGLAIHEHCTSFYTT